jgi:hypothetical protein
MSDADLVLFSFDDVSIPWHNNLKLTLEQPRKYEGNPVLRPGPSGSVDDVGTILYGTIIRVGKTFRMWYVPWFQPDPRFPKEITASHSDTQTFGYAESDDGIHWRRPDLGLVDFRGNKHNNLLEIEPTSNELAHPMNFLSVLFEPNDPDPAQRYKMVYCVNPPHLKFITIGTAVSSDGFRWHLVNKDEFTHGLFEVSSLIKFDGFYYASGQNIYPFGGHLPDGTPAGRTMTVFYSPDFVNWSGERALSFFRSDYVPKPTSYGQEVHMGAALWNRGNVIVGLYGRWYGDTIKDQSQDFMTTPGTRWRLDGVKIDLGLIVSNDGIHYREPVRNFVVIPHGEPSQWDSEAILQANAFYNTDKETYIWYSHSDFNIPYALPPAPEKINIKTQGIGLVTMRRDGFGYLSKLLASPVDTWHGKFQPRQTSLLTRSIRLRSPSKLLVNVADVSQSSPLLLDLVDDSERPLSGFGATTVKDDSVKALVQWNGRTTIPADMSFRIRVRWPETGDTNPRLYALYVEAEKPGAPE